MEISQHISFFEEKMKKFKELVKAIEEYNLPIEDFMLHIPIPNNLVTEGTINQLNRRICNFDGNNKIIKTKDVIVLKKSPSLKELSEKFNNESIVIAKKEDHDNVDFIQTGVSEDLKTDEEFGGNYPSNFSISLEKENQPKRRKLVKKIKESKEKGDNIPILEKLQNYECCIEHRYNPRTKRTNKIIICKYEGCGKEFNKTWNVLDHFKTHTGEKPFECEC